MDFNDLVGRDLGGQKLSETEYQSLYGNLEKWRDRLVEKLRDVDHQFTQRRAISLAERTPQARVEYEGWRANAVKYKYLITNRLSEVKLMLKERNKVESGQSEFVMDDILKELRKISGLLEVRLRA